MTKKRIIIAGGGFGGITAALTLAREKKLLTRHGYEIVLIDRHHHQLFTPALYEIAALPKEMGRDGELKSFMLIPFSEIFERGDVTTVCDEIVDINFSKKELTLKKDGSLGFEFLVLALGSETNYFNIPGLKDYSFPLKTFDDAIRLRNKIESSVQKSGHLKIAVGGAGASGVELIAEFVNFVCAIKEKENKNNICDVEYVLIEAGPEILAGLPKKAITLSRMRLEKLGVAIRVRSAISSVSAQEITYADKTKETFDILVWTGGVRGPELLEKLNLPLTPKGAIAINEYLRVGNEKTIYAIGDNSSMLNPKTDKLLPWTVPIAESQGRITAKNIILQILNLAPKKFVPLKEYPFVLAIGEKYAIADLVLFRISGILGWIIKQLVELRYLLFILSPRKAIIAWVRAVRVYSSND